MDLLRKPGGPFRVDFCLQFGSDREKEDTTHSSEDLVNGNTKQAEVF